MEEMLVALTDAYSARDGGVPITLVLKGTRTAPPALADGSSVLAPMGAEMSDDELASYRRLRGNDPVEIRVAHDSLKHDSISSPTGIFVNAENPLRRISLDQLRHVFAASPTSSAISRWGQLGLGGPWTNRPIDAAGLGPKTAIGRHLLRYVLRSDRYVDRFGDYPESREVAKIVGEDRNAIGLFNLSHGNCKVRALAIIDDHNSISRGRRADIAAGRYPLDRTLLVYARREANGALEPFARDFLRFMLSDEGQRIIGRGSKGYIPLNPAERRVELAKLDP